MTTTSSSTSGSVLQALGLGSGLDIATLSSTLTDAEMSPANSRISRQQQSVTTQVSAVASLKAALSAFQASLLALTSGSTFSSRSAVSGDTSIVKVSADTTAAVGTYDVKVTQLAKSQQLLSTNFTGGSSTVVGTGDLTLSLGGNSFTVTIDSNNSTLAKIRDAINGSADNTGINATLIYGTNGAQLLLSGNTTGETNTIEVTTSGGDGNLSALTYGTGNTANYSVYQPAQDSIVEIAGVQHQSSSNTVSGAIDGLTLTLVSEAPTTSVSLKISNSNTNIATLVQAFVTSYNTLNTQLSKLAAYDATSGTAAALFGDAMYSNVRRLMDHALRDPVSGIDSVYKSLSSLGVTTDASGNLVTNSSKLNAALDADFKSAAAVFNGDSGIIKRLDAFLDKALGSDGLIAARDATLTSQQKQIDNQKALIAIRTQQVQARYLAKFNAMDSLLAQLHSTSNYLTQTFDALTNNNGK